MFYKLLFTIIFLFLTYSINAQIMYPARSSANSLSVRGHIICPAGTIFDTLIVRLSGTTSSGDSTTTVFPNGDFEFMSVAPGSYRVSLTDISGNKIMQEVVTISERFPEIQLRFPEHRMERPGVGTVSLFELAHKVPRGARKEMQAAVKALGKGDSAICIQHLAKVVQIDPEFLDAQRQLGNLYLTTQPAKAVETFGKV